MTDIRYWNNFYSHKLAPTVPSQFAVSVCQELIEPSLIVEFGCGNGRDASFFTNCGHQVFAIDACPVAIENVRKSNKSNKNLHTLCAELSTLDIKLIEGWANDRAINIYSRFFQHSISEAEQETMLGSLKEISTSTNKLFFEFRNEKDAAFEKTFGDHYRRFQSADSFSAVLKQHGFDTVYSVCGQGMAKYFGEDPHVSRVIAIPSH